MTLRAEFITNRQFVAILVTTVTIAYSSKDQNNLHAVAQEPVSYNFYQRILQTNNWKVLLRKLLRTFLLTLFLLSWNKGFAQKQDNIWYFGWGFKPKTDSINIADSAWGGTNFDFNFDPPKVYYDPVRNLSIEASNASICDENGDMIFYSNGMQIAAADGSFIADTIAYNTYWEQNKILYKSNVYTYGNSLPHTSIILPVPGSSNLYYIFYNLYDNSIYSSIGLLYSLIENSDIGANLLHFKDKILLQDTIGAGGMNACRHSNGRDWWLLCPTENSPQMHTFLIDPDGIHDHGLQYSGVTFSKGLGQLYFSPDGSKVAINRGLYVESPEGAEVHIWQFDRCNGLMSNALVDTIATQGIGTGTSFSPNGRFLYATNDLYVFQYDLWATDIIKSRMTVAIYDNYKYIYPEDPNEPPFELPVSMGWMGPAPDGRIYISGTNGSRKMGVIEFPNEKGIACTVRQHAIDMPTSYFRSIPNFPNFRMGPLDGSSCDTLGIDNLPIAKFRFEQDSTQYLKIRFTDLSYYEPKHWSWDFGDGQYSSEKSPYHTFDKGGDYDVCLTVSNEYGSNTNCRFLHFATSSLEETDTAIISISLFPNPVHDILLLSIQNYLPKNAMAHFYDLNGKEAIRAQVRYGWNSIDMSQVVAGLYIYTIKDQEKVIQTGKIVKQ